MTSSIPLQTDRRYCTTLCEKLQVLFAFFLDFTAILPYNIHTNNMRCDMNNADVYIEKYKQLEKAVRDTYRLKQGDSISRFLCTQEKYAKLADDIRYCQEVRNWLQHESKVSGEFAIEPSDSMISFIDDLIDKVNSPLRCGDIAVKYEKIFWQNMQASIKDTVHTMRTKGFSHVPILKSGMVVGVFDENSVFNYLADNGSISLDGKMKLYNIQKYLTLDGRKTERFLFVKSATYVEDLHEKIQYESKRGNRVVMAFVTATGKQNSQLKGIVTPLDVINADK